MGSIRLRCDSLSNGLSDSRERKLHRIERHAVAATHGGMVGAQGALQSAAQGARRLTSDLLRATRHESLNNAS